MDWTRDPSGFAVGRTANRSPKAYRLLRSYRRLIEPALDGLIWAFALLVSSLLRFELHTGLVFRKSVGVTIAVAIVAQLIVGYATVLYRVRWQVGSFEEMAALARTVIITTCMVTLASVVLGHAVPLSASIAAGALTLVLAGGARSTWRLNWERHIRPTGRTERVVVFGAGTGGRQVISALIADPTSPYVAVALLDDDPEKRNLRIRGLQVSGGAHDIVSVAKRCRATAVIVAIPSADSELIRKLSNMAAEADLAMRTLPQVSGLFGPALSIKDIRPVTEADLLGRHSIDTEIDAIAGYLKGRRVLVTGAGGSIGSEICRQIHRFAPSKLIMLDHDESGLHHVELSIAGRAMLDDRRLVVCDIRDREALGAVFDEHQPEVVFHAAALKHLPLLEMWPVEAVKTNVFATLTVLELSVVAGVQRFVNISTDKAANPCSVLGYTKRLAERLTASIAEEAEGVYLSVRFGNVLGSRGSVLTAFRAQVDAGGPITVTDPDVTRYFMTVEEAVQLVIQAGAVGRNGEALILDMGSPVRIADVAERLAREAPGPIEIVYTGLRPGEKLHEELFGDGEIDQRPTHRLISHVPVSPLALELIADLGLKASANQVIERLRACTQTGSRELQQIPRSPEYGLDGARDAGELVPRAFGQ